ncbi:MAG: DUF3465 domain-containing protein [Gammaproteobacteria bacterium]
MKKLLLLIVFTVSYFSFPEATRLSRSELTATQVYSDKILVHAYENHRSNLQVQGQGIVIRILPDDNHGSRHQRFIIQLASGQTLMISHNIDLAPRIDELNKGDQVEFAGEYEWSHKGGVIHWTHHDPAKRHPYGWLKHKGLIYQ